MRRAIFCGTFDPMTLGHIDILKKAGRVFDRIYVAVPEISGKSNGFSLQSRIKIARASVEELDFVEVVSFSGLLTDFCKALDVFTLVRGIRNVSDFVYENDLLKNYQTLNERIECAYFLPSSRLSHISSSIVREILCYGGDIQQYVSANAVQLITDEFSK